jgi:hypothetical protein
MTAAGRGLVLAVAVAAGGCARAPSPEAAAKPSRPIREIGPEDADLFPVTLAAAARLRSVTSGQRVAFGGVFVAGRELPPITEELIRVFGFIQQPPGRQGVTCDRVATPAQRTSRAEGPYCAMVDVDALYSFSLFRVGRDSAYVGGSTLQVRGGRPDTHAICITLALQGPEWIGVRNSRVSRVEECGR